MGDFISNEHLASAALQWLPFLPEASECPFVSTILNDHPIMLVLIWQTPFLFLKIQRNKKRNETIKIENIRKNVKFLEKENKATSFVILAFLVYTFNINAMC